ncbi:MAG: DegV family protein [Candidatus Heimdallarchaeota archaeon]|nr:DegV family protein [Candidatus Heimdallarchaeota archaeon]
MPKIALLTDGSCDLPKELIDKYNIGVIPFRVNFGIESYKTYGDWGTLSKEEFYHKLRTSKEFPTSSIPAPKDIHDGYKEALSKANTVIAIFLSQKFSGLIQSASKIKEEMFQGEDITIVDSRVSTSSLGALVVHTAKMIDQNYSKEEILSSLNSLIPQTKLIAILDSVNEVYRSGRVGWSKKFLVLSLQIKPIVNFKDGLIVPGGTIFGRKEVIKKLKFVAPIIAKKAITDNIFIWHVRNQSIAQEIYDTMEANNVLGKEIRIQEAGPVVGTHVGEKSLGIMYIGDYEKKWLTRMKI